MANSVKDIMFALIRRAVCGTELSESVKSQITPELLKELYDLAKPQDIAHIIAEALLCEDLLPEGEIKSVYSKEKMTAVFRYAQIRHELARIYTALDEAKIKYMPLKGSVIRSYYPKPELRTSCDIDVFIDETDLEIAEQIFLQKLNYAFDVRTAHDVAFFSASRTHVELHFDLIENDDKIRGVLSHAWEESIPDGQYSYCRIMNNEMFLYYHIAHMAKHFASSGGCGVRPFLDLWIIKNKMGYDEKKLLTFLRTSSLEVFANYAMLLSEVWFDGATHTELTREMENYILGASIYGDVENRVALSQIKQGGRFKHILGRLFLPYNKLNKIYPRLKKYPALLPYYQVKRWFRFVFRKRTAIAFKELKANATVSDEKKRQLSDMCASLGLDLKHSK